MAEIRKNKKAQLLLKRQKLDWDKVVPAERKIILHDKIVLSAGADVIDETDHIHYKNTALLERAAQLFDVDLIGFDVICEDISDSYENQSFAIIEANSAPYIDMHRYPSAGTERHVAEDIVELCFGDK